MIISVRTRLPSIDGRFTKLSLGGSWMNMIGSLKRGERRWGLICESAFFPLPFTAHFPLSLHFHSHPPTRHRIHVVHTHINHTKTLTHARSKFGGMIRQTTRAHRLLALAYRTGGSALQLALLEHLFHARHVEEKDIGNVDLLAFYADKVGGLIFLSSMKRILSINYSHRWASSQHPQQPVGCGQKTSRRTFGD
jgi:hypothetical protein